MARDKFNKPVDLIESSVYGNDGKDNPANDRGDTADEATSIALNRSPAAPTSLESTRAL
jgi:hypothetical protein